MRVLRVHPGGPRGDPLQLTYHGIANDPALRLFSLEPSRNAIVSGSIDIGIEIRDWTRNRSVMVRIAEANYDNNQESILGLRLVGDYVLCFTSKWVELFYIPPFPDADVHLISELDPTSRPFHLKYQRRSFDGASVSEQQPNPESPDNSRIVYILARQMIVGFFYFRVTIYNPDHAPSGPRARMDVDLIGVYEPEVRWMDEPHLVSGSLIGPEGKRCICVESSLGGFRMVVVAVSFDQTGSAGVPVRSGGGLEDLCKILPRIESTGDVFVVESWDGNGGRTLPNTCVAMERLKYLPDDVVQYAFSESTGKIVLGTQDDRIILL